MRRLLSIHVRTLQRALAVVGAYLLLKVVDLLIGLLVSEEDEMEGLDFSQHGEDGYSADLDLIPVESAIRSIDAPASGGTAVLGAERSLFALHLN